MRLELKCQADAYAGFKSGLFKAIIVEGRRNLWQIGSPVNLSDIVVVTNCDSDSRLVFQVYQIALYMGASTIKHALEDVNAQLHLCAENYESTRIYMAPNERAGLLPMLSEGIHAIMIKPYEKKPTEGDGNQHNNNSVN